MAEFKIRVTITAIVTADTKSYEGSAKTVAECVQYEQKQLSEDIFQACEIMEGNNPTITVQQVFEE